MKRVAFLRGINVGGHTKVPMQALRGVFESLGYHDHDVRTLLNSGNVVFDGNGAGNPGDATIIEQALEAEFGFHVDVVVREQQALQELVEADPFSGVDVSPSTRLYVTFRGDGRIRSGRESALTAPYRSPEGDLQMLRVTDAEICTVVMLSPQRGTVDLMKFLEKEFGRNITTRSWNTVMKVAAL